MVAKEFAGLDWWEDQNILSFTTGASTGTAAPSRSYNTAGTGALLTSGWARQAH